MEFHGEAPIRLLEVGLAGVPAYAQDFVVIAFRHPDLRLAAR
jgi:hypothetical protein